MKTFTRIGSLAVVLLLAGWMTGCATHESTAGVRHARDFEIVETSTKRNLTSAEMAELRSMVAEYLRNEGATDEGDYYVKVFLSPKEEGVAEEWVVVRYSNPTAYTATRFSLLTSYPSYYEPYSSFYSYDYYPFSYYGFGRLSFQYYDDPYFYGYRNYYPRRPHYAGHGHHGHRHHGNHGHHGRDRDKDRDRDDHRPPFVHRPPQVQPPAPPPQVTARTRWNSNSPERNGQHRDHTFPHRTDPRRRTTQQPNVNPAQRVSQPAVAPASTLAQPSTPANPASSPRRVTTRRDQATENMAPANRPAPSNRPVPVNRPNFGARERAQSPATGNVPARSSREIGAQNTPRPNRSDHTPAPSARATTPAPSYTPAATRSDPEPQQSQRANVNDGGRRARSQ